MRALSLSLTLIIIFSSADHRVALSETPEFHAQGTFHRFQSNTVWGKLNVLIKAYPDHFIAEVKSDALASGWILKEETTTRTVSKGGMGPKNQFEFSVNKPYSASYRLTVFLNADRQEVPTIVHLSPKSEHVLRGSMPETVEDFEPNSHHSYNVMVKDLYADAIEEYSKGRYKECLAFLHKAEELDPHQPQVRSLMKQARAKLLESDEPDLLKSAKREHKKGNKEAALAKIADYLDQNPDDPDAIELRNTIEGRDPDRVSLSKPLPRTKKPDPSIKSAPQKPTHSQLDEQTQQAKADQAYNLGLESYRKEDHAAAKKFWEETLRISPTHFQAKRNLERLKKDHPGLP